MTTGACLDCGESTAHKRKTRCSSCRKLNDKVSRFRLTPSEYRELEAQQDGLCAICQAPCPSGRRLAVDHDHLCCGPKAACDECRRGLLCVRCNVGLGNFRDNAMLLLQAAHYLLKGKTLTEESYGTYEDIYAANLAPQGEFESAQVVADYDRLHSNLVLPRYFEPADSFEFTCSGCNLIAHVSGRSGTVCRDCH